MVEREFKKWQLAFIVGLIFIIPVIIVFQYTGTDIVIDFDDNPFKNKCFLGQSECVYDSDATELREDDTYWWILGTDVWCVKSQMSFTEPVTNPNIEITQDSEVSCNDIAMFDKNDWDFSILHLDLIDGGFLDRYIFTLKGT